MRLSVRVPGGCWPRRCRPRWTPTLPVRGGTRREGRRLVVRNGYHQAREVLTSAGAIEVRAPRVNDKRTDPDSGERRRFSSAILPPWARKTPKVTEVLPLLYLHGLSLGTLCLPWASSWAHPPGGAQAVPAGDDRSVR
jgi:Transposase, Mutator family